MAEPQPILTPLTPAAIFLIVTINEGGEDVVRDVLADVQGLQRSIGFRVPAAGLACVTGIGSAAWDRLFGDPRPAELHPFREVQGNHYHAPSTPGDILFHIRAQTLDVCFELASVLVERLGEAATVVDDTNGFRYFEQRDLLGFVDGTENPTGAAAPDAVLIGEEDPDFAGGSYVIVQRYVHPLHAWNALSVDEQERIIGRTKLGDYELPDDVQPVDSHLTLTQVTDENGDELQIVRHNMPFGSVREQRFGTYFIGYAASPHVIEVMLEQMFLGKGAAHHDRLLDFSTAETGCLFFVPTREFLDDPPPASGDATTGAAPPAPAATDHSLGIGSLKRSTTA